MNKDEKDFINYYEEELGNLLSPLIGDFYDNRFIYNQILGQVKTMAENKYREIHDPDIIMSDIQKGGF